MAFLIFITGSFKRTYKILNFNFNVFQPWDFQKTHSCIKLSYLKYYARYVTSWVQIDVTWQCKCFLHTVYFFVITYRLRMAYIWNTSLYQLCWYIKIQYLCWTENYCYCWYYAQWDEQYKGTPFVCAATACVFIMVPSLDGPWQT